jgi:hypothetical protein
MSHTREVAGLVGPDEDFFFDVRHVGVWNSICVTYKPKEWRGQEAIAPPALRNSGRADPWLLKNLPTLRDTSNNP